MIDALKYLLSTYIEEYEHNHPGLKCDGVDAVVTARKAIEDAQVAPRLRTELVVLNDAGPEHDNVVKGEITIYEGVTVNGIFLSVEGYETFTGDKDIITVEYYEGKLLLHIWDEINREDPISYSLEAARKENREDE